MVSDHDSIPTRRFIARLQPREAAWQPLWRWTSRNYEAPVAARLLDQGRLLHGSFDYHYYRHSYYLKGQSTSYPTVLLDFDGNERASIHLRDNDLNLLHILCSSCNGTNCRSRCDARRLTLSLPQLSGAGRRQKHLDEPTKSSKRCAHASRNIRNSGKRSQNNLRGGKSNLLRRSKEAVLCATRKIDGAGEDLFGIRSHPRDLLALRKESSPRSNSSWKT